MHLSLLPAPPPAEPYFHLQETQGEPLNATQKSVVEDPERDQTQPDGGNTSQKEDEPEDSSSSASSSEGESDDDPEMAELLRENSASGSSDEDESERSPSKLPPTATRKIGKKGVADRYDSPASNIAVLMLACWTMRIPVMCVDFRKSVVPTRLFQ